MNKVTTIYDAKTNLSKYIKQAKAGHPVYIGSYGVQEVVLMSAKPVKTQIKFGTGSGKLSLVADQHTSEIDKDIQEMFYGKEWDNS